MDIHGHMQKQPPRTKDQELWAICELSDVEKLLKSLEEISYSRRRGAAAAPPRAQDRAASPRGLGNRALSSPGRNPAQSYPRAPSNRVCATDRPTDGPLSGSPPAKAVRPAHLARSPTHPAPPHLPPAAPRPPHRPRPPLGFPHPPQPPSAPYASPHTPTPPPLSPHTPAPVPAQPHTPAPVPAQPHTPAPIPAHPCTRPRTPPRPLIRRSGP
uniref:uncharacterized protein LOC129522787 n=1 Tax=Nyctereutes procyonoides TaxID=34880 RepID=UPI002443C14D|nr:uncharacterized protein LOC129522787 [Nyctereutes procyonoides]